MARTTRRGFLGLAGAAAAFGIIGLRPKSGRADGPPRAKRVLIFNAGGGLRNTAAFYAVTNTLFNPYGMLGNYGALRLGKLVTLDPASVTYDAPSWGTRAPGGKIPDITQAAAQMSVIGAVNHDEVGFRGGDHTDETPRMGTGYFASPSPGALTVLWRYLSPSNPPLPALSLGGGGMFDFARGPWLPFAPVEANAQSLPSGSALAPASTFALEDAMDQGLRSRRNGAAGAYLDAYKGLKAAMRKYGPVLTKPELHVANSAYADVAVAGITNKMLLEATGLTGGDAAKIALAIRALQMGSPGVMCGMGGFDLHSEEKQKGPAAYTRYGRALAGIHFALSQIPDPSGAGSLLANTLVVSTSEFDRAVDNPSGWNDKDGSDHSKRGSKPNPHQSHIVFGAGITPKAVAPTSNDNEPTNGQKSTHALLATICAAVGVPQPAIDEVWGPGGPLYPDGRPIWELWS
jgi:hypothetical protein